MTKIAVFPGSFDPITRGHETLVKRALPLFDEIVVAIGINAGKNYMFSLEQRTSWIKKTFENEPKVKVATYEGLTVNFCKTVGANYILRGLRNETDFAFERNIAQMNQAMDAVVETIFLITNPEHAAINSSIVRDIIRNHGDVSQFIPKGISIAK